MNKVSLTVKFTVNLSWLVFLVKFRAFTVAAQKQADKHTHVTTATLHQDIMVGYKQQLNSAWSIYRDITTL